MTVPDSYAVFQGLEQFGELRFGPSPLAMSTSPVLAAFCDDPGPPKGTIEESGGQLMLSTYEDPHGNTWLDAAYVNSKIDLKIGSDVRVDFTFSGLLEYHVIWSGGQVWFDISGLDKWYVRFYVDTAVSVGTSTGRLHSTIWIDSVWARIMDCP